MFLGKQKSYGRRRGLGCNGLIFCLFSAVDLFVVGALFRFFPAVQASGKFCVQRIMMEKGAATRLAMRHAGYPAA